MIYASWSKLSPSSSYGKNVKERKHLHHQSLSISSGEENVRFMNANISITPENMHAHLTQSEKHALTYSCPFVRVRVESRPRFTSNLSCQVCIIIPSTSDFFHISIHVRLCRHFCRRTFLSAKLKQKKGILKYQTNIGSS